jgi:thioredoxin-related protein
MKFLRVIFSFGLVLVLTSSYAPVPESKVNWITFEEAIILHNDNPKKLLIDLYTDWCGWCKVMDRETYSNQIISDYINQNFYPVKFNAEQREAVEFKGHTFNFVASGNRGYHELAAALTRNKLSYPTTVFMDEELRILQAMAGYLKPHQMEPIVEYMAEGHYKTIPWADFQKNHKSSL